jgi:predicted RNA-binding Zn-ribbon protein involved in translation (DUF1610 family)
MVAGSGVLEPSGRADTPVADAIAEENMPHVTCPDCGLRTYTAAAWSSLDPCPRCGRALPRRHAETVNRPSPSARKTQVESAQAALARLRERPA